MLVGEPAFSGPTAIAMAVARLQQPAPDPREHAEVPDPLAELVNRCLQRHPTDRPASAREVGDALSSWLASPTGSKRASSSASGSGRRRSGSLSPEGERRHVAALFVDLAQVDAGGRAVDPEEMDEAERHAGALEEHDGADPVPWVALHAGRGRALAAWGRGERGERLRAELERFRREARAATMNAAAATIDEALAGA